MRSTKVLKCNPKSTKMWSTRSMRHTQTTGDMFIKILSGLCISEWVHPPGNPRGLAQNIARGVEIWLLKITRGQKFDKGRDFVESESEYNIHCFNWKSKLEYLRMLEYMLQSHESSWMEIPINFTDHSEFITDQVKRILSKVIKNEIKCFDFGSIKRELVPHLRTIMAR